MPPTDAEVRREIVKANPRNDKTMFKIFQNVQYNVVQHRKYVKEMTKLYKKVYRLIVLSDTILFLFNKIVNSENLEVNLNFILYFHKC